MLIELEQDNLKEIIAENKKGSGTIFGHLVR